MPQPLYTVSNCRVAYQLHWSLTLFTAKPWPLQDSWWTHLREAVEPDGVRLLEFHAREIDSGQFLVSSKPGTSPAEILRSIKGRLQTAVRETTPRLW